MTSDEFVIWLEGVLDATDKAEQTNRATTLKLIKDKLKDVTKCAQNPVYIPVNVPAPITPVPYTDPTYPYPYTPLPIWAGTGEDPNKHQPHNTCDNANNNITG